MIFTWFVDKVIGNRRKDDENPEQALLAEVYNLLGNSSYGKLIEAVEQQMTVKYIKSENALRKDLQYYWCGFRIWKKSVMCAK